MQTIKLPDDVYCSIVEMLNYLADEESHYEQTCEEEGTPQENHIWTHRERVREFIESLGQ